MRVLNCVLNVFKPGFGGVGRCIRSALRLGRGLACQQANAATFEATPEPSSNGTCVLTTHSHCENPLPAL